jgi:uncharacterized protein YfkK (UPF0435 family)
MQKQSLVRELDNKLKVVKQGLTEPEDRLLTVQNYVDFLTTDQ